MLFRHCPGRFVSGGQTGVDRAALDTALDLGLSCGGWVPRGRRSEDGPLPDRYPVRETKTAEYAERTRLNVRDSDATLILTRGVPTGGTALTVSLARQLNRPCLVLDLDRGSGIGQARDWLAEARPAVLNVAGPRESTAPGIYAAACRFLRGLLT